jgi:hypothetical protein
MPLLRAAGRPLTAPPPSRNRAAAPAVLATRLVDSVSSIWHTALAGGAPSLGNCPSSPCRVASQFRTSSMHISWPPTLRQDPSCRGYNGDGDLSAGILEINDDGMDRARPRPHRALFARQGTSCPSHFASAATHNTSQAALYSSTSCAGDPLLVIDHRIMLDVESVPGPSLLSSFGAPQERSVSWRQPIAVLAWILCPCGNRTETDRAFEGTYCPKNLCLLPSGVNIL